MDKIISLSAFGDIIKPQSDSSKHGKSKETVFSEDNRFDYIFKMILQNSAQAKLLHLQSALYGQHKALDKFWNAFNKLSDGLAESIMGKYGKPVLEEQNLKLCLMNFENPKDGDLSDFMSHLTKCYNIDCKSIFNENTDAELLNIIDEIVALIEQTKYLLSLR